MEFMLLRALGVYEDVINEHYYEPVQKLMKYTVHIVHEDAWCIRDFERHHQVLIIPIAGPECCSWNICISYPDLVISRLQVDLRKDHGPTQLIHEVIDMREWILVIDGYLVELPVVHTSP